LRRIDCVSLNSRLESHTEEEDAPQPDGGVRCRGLRVRVESVGGRVQVVRCLV